MVRRERVDQAMSKVTAKGMRALTGIKRKVWHYSGDVDIAYGGMFYNLDDIENGYANAVRVTPCADAGGPDNMWWVERITINVHNGTWPYEGVGETAAERAAHRVLHDMIDSTAEAALNSYGFDSNLAAWDDLTPRQREHTMVFACAGYGRFDTDSTEMIQIGKPDPFWKPRGETYTPDKILRGNTSLRRYVRSQCS
jgi:hypothetical protein